MNQPTAKLIDGEYHLNPAMTLLVVASTVYGDPTECSRDGYRKAEIALDSILSDAIKNGFKKADIFRTLLARGDSDQRIKNLASEAMQFIKTADDFANVLRRAGFDR